MEFQRQQLYEWNQRVAAVTEHNSRMTQLMFASMATGQIPTMEPPPPPPGPQPVVPTFEQFLADHYNVTPVSTSPTYSTTTSRLFNTIIYCLTISFQTCREPVDHPPVVVLLMVPLLSHGAQSLRSGLAAAVAVALALAVAVTTSALAASALAVEVMPLKPFIVIMLDLR
jgi:hypothetical protein